VPAHQALVGTEADVVAVENELTADELEAEIEAVAEVEAESPSEGEPPVAPSAAETVGEAETTDA
jgi:hypothetical protein